MPALNTVNMSASDNLVEFIKTAEGFRATAYLDPRGIPTIGFGHTCTVTYADVTAGRTITYAEAEALLHEDIIENENSIATNFAEVPLTQNQFDVLVDLRFNIGSGNFYQESNIAKYVDERDQDALFAEMDEFGNANGTPLPGLQYRIQARKDLWQTADDQSVSVEPASGAVVTLPAHEPMVIVPTVPSTEVESLPGFSASLDLVATGGEHQSNASGGEPGFFQSIWNSIKSFFEKHLSTTYEVTNATSISATQEYQNLTGVHATALEESQDWFSETIPVSYETPSSNLHVGVSNQVVTPGEVIALTDLFPEEHWVDNDGEYDIVSFAVQDRSEGGGFLTYNGQSMASGRPYEASISDLNNWAFVAGQGGSLDEIGFNIIQADGTYSERLDTGALVMSLNILHDNQRPEDDMAVQSTVLNGQQTSISQWDHRGTGEDDDIRYPDADDIRLYDGDDTLRANGSSNVIWGDSGDDRVYGNGGHDEILGGYGEDRLYGQSGNDELYGQQDDDNLYGGTGNDRLAGEGGEDYLDGDEGNDELYGGDGDDHLRGEEGEDLLFGQSGDDRANGHEDNDQLYGGAGQDTLDGGDGDDRLAGEAGDDNLYAGDGDDDVFGGTGNDHLYDDGDGDDYFHGEGGIDTIDFSRLSDGISANLFDEIAVGDDAGVNTLHGLENIIGSYGNDVIDGNDGNNELSGVAGNDVIRGHGGNDVIRGGIENDAVWGDAGHDLVYGDADDDEVRGGLGNDVLYGGSGNDWLAGEQGLDVIHGGDGIDTAFFWGEWQDFEFTLQSDLSLNVRDTRVDGLEGTDRLYNVEYVEFFNGHFSFDEAITLDPTAVPSVDVTVFVDGEGLAPNPDLSWETFDERFVGTAENDIIYGGTGEDWFTASTGDDVYYGGDGVSDDPSYNQYVIDDIDISFSDFTWSYDAETDALSSQHELIGSDQFDHDVAGFWFHDAGWFSRSALIDLVQVSPTVFVDGQGAAADPLQTWQWWDERFDGPDFAGDEIIYAGLGDDDIVASTGDDVVYGGEGYNQITVTGNFSDFVFSIDPDSGLLASTHSTFGYDQYSDGIDFWFQTGGWKGYDEIYSLAGNSATVFNDGDGNPPDPAQTWQWWDERFDGPDYAGDEFIFAGLGDDDIVASTGDDVIDGGEGSNQVTVLGDFDEFVFSIDPDSGYLASTHSTFGYDQYAPGINFWFETGGWMAYDAVFELA